MQQQDTIKVNTIIAYPSTKQSALESREMATPQSTVLIERDLHKVSYDSVALGFGIGAVSLFLLLRIVAKRKRESLLALYFYTQERLGDFVRIPQLSFLQHLLSFATLFGVLYYLLSSLNLPLERAEIIGYTFAVLVGFLFLLPGFILLLGHLFRRKAIALGHTRIMYWTNKLLGFAFLPICLLLLFSESNVFSLVCYVVTFFSGLKIILQISYLYRFLRARKFSVFHCFLYLCALEILPLIYIVIMGRIFIS